VLFRSGESTDGRPVGDVAQRAEQLGVHVDTVGIGQRGGTTLLAIALLMAAAVGALVVYDGESTWEEGAILIGLYVVIAASFWWGA